MLLLAACGTPVDSAGDAPPDDTTIAAQGAGDDTDRFRDDPTTQPTDQPTGDATTPPTDDVSEPPSIEPTTPGQQVTDDPDDPPTTKPPASNDQPGDGEKDDSGDPPSEVTSGTTFTLAEGQTVRFESLKITLVRADAADPEDCQDCPLEAEVVVTDGRTTERLLFRFSGNMPADTAEEARTAEAFGHTFRIARVIPGEADLRID
jgi:hypothetical protein